MYSDRLFFPGLDGRFLTWCGQLLDRHLSWYFKYIGVLVLGPFPMMWSFKLIGLHKIAERAQSKYGGILSGKPYPGYTLVRTVACILFLPFVPTIIAAVVACIIGICVMAGIALYGLVSFGRMGGSRYFITRWAVRDGIRDAMNRRLR